MKLIRRIRLYLGCFFAPLLIFYVATGWYQTVNPDRRKGVADSNDLISRLNRVHVEQYYPTEDRKSTRLNSSHRTISYAVFCLKKKTPSPTYLATLTNSHYIDSSLYN